MPGIKRKASRTSSYEPASKLTKEKTTSSISPLRKDSTVRPPLPLPKWPSLKRTPTKEASIAETPGDSSPPPGLRRAATLTLEEKSPSSSSSLTGKKSLSKTGSIVGEVITAPSLPKTASIVEGGDVVTTLTKLSSGSSIGRTTSFSSAPAAISKELSKTGSVSKVPMIAKSISRGGSIVLDTGDIPALSKTPSKSKSVSSDAVLETEIALDKIVSLSKYLSKPSMSKEKYASLIAAVAEKDAVEEEEEEDGGAVTADIPLPPGGLMEIVFSFDTTGSMYSVLDQVRNRIADMVQRLQADIPGIRIAIFAHGDYCDKDTYVVQWIDFGASAPEICKFVKEVSGTGGGDYPEAYEVVLKRCQTVLSWTPGSQRSLVMIGDAVPHPASDHQNEENIDWKTEVKCLGGMGVRIYGVQASNNADSKKFFAKMGKDTGGLHLKLDQFSNIFDIIMAICYRERSDDLLEAFEEEVRGRHSGGALSRDLEAMFGKLRPDDDGSSDNSSEDDVPGPHLLPTGALRKITSAVSAKGAAKKTKGAGKSKAAVKKTKTASKKKSKRPKREGTHREKLKDTMQNRRGNLIFDKMDQLDWTPWLRAIIPYKHNVRDCTIKKRSKGSFGFYKVNIFKREFDVPAIYEFGVKSTYNKLHKRIRIYPTYCRSSKGFKATRQWERHLIPSDLVKDAIDGVLRQYGEIHVRRGTMASYSDAGFKALFRELTQKVDYAWNPQGSSPMRGKRIVKASIVIAGKELFSYVVKTDSKKTDTKTKKAKPATKKVKTAAKKTKTAAKKTKTAPKKATADAKKAKTAAKKAKTAAKKTKAAALKKATAAKKSKTATKKTTKKTVTKKTKPTAKKAKTATKTAKPTKAKAAAKGTKTKTAKGKAKGRK